jgi:para-nitrobenzyl esterase
MLRPRANALGARVKSSNKSPAKRTAKKRASPLRGSGASRSTTPAQPTVPVTVENFKRAESHMYFAKMVADDGLGRMSHRRAPVAIDEQDVIRMNRDTLYSSALFDLDAGAVTITLPDAGKRFMSLLIIDEDHYTLPVVYAPGSFSFTRDQVGTRYMLAVVRTLADAGSAADVKAANAAQDGIRVQQAAHGTFEIPNWDAAARDEMRKLLLALAAKAGPTTAERFGPRDKVDPIQHLLATAAGWGGNPREAAVYAFGTPQANDGKTIHRLTVRDVPVDGFWSITVYNSAGFMEKNKAGSYSANNLTAKPNADGSFTLEFGSSATKSPNYLFTPKGWNYIVRMYKPRKPVLDGTWQFPEPKPVGAAR